MLSNRTEPRGVRKIAKGHSVTLQVESMPPKDILIHLHTDSPHDLRVWVPFPERCAERSMPRTLGAGSVMSLRHRGGRGILVFDQNPDQPKKYEVELDQATSCAARARLVSRRRVPPSVFAEVRLLDL